MNSGLLGYSLDVGPICQLQLTANVDLLFTLLGLFYWLHWFAFHLQCRATLEWAVPPEQSQRKPSPGCIVVDLSTPVRLLFAPYFGTLNTCMCSRRETVFKSLCVLCSQCFCSFWLKHFGLKSLHVTHVKTSISSDKTHLQTGSSVIMEMQIHAMPSQTELNQGGRREKNNLLVTWFPPFSPIVFTTATRGFLQTVNTNKGCNKILTQVTYQTGLRAGCLSLEENEKEDVSLKCTNSVSFACPK